MKRRDRVAALTLVVGLIGLPPAVAAHAQDRPPQATGRIAGVVQDPAGQPVASQVVLLRRPGTRNMLSRTTDADGAFVFAELPPGRYEVVITIVERTVTRAVELAPEAMRAEHLTLVVSPPDRPTPAGQQIRVFLRNGQRLRVRLVTLTATELVTRDGDADRTLALADVSRVERVPHHARNLGLAGLGVGLAISLAACPTVSACPDDTPGSNAGAALWAVPIATVTGAVIGAVLNATADRTIWAASSSSTSMSMRPVLSPHEKGVHVLIRW